MRKCMGTYNESSHYFLGNYDTIFADYHDPN